MDKQFLFIPNTKLFDSSSYLPLPVIFYFAIDLLQPFFPASLDYLPVYNSAVIFHGFKKGGGSPLTFFSSSFYSVFLSAKLTS